MNEKQLILYYGIGKYISLNSRNGFWGKGAIDAISEQLDKELPGLRRFTSRNLRYMRTFYEEWQMLDSIGQPEKIAENVSDNLEFANSKTEKTYKTSKDMSEKLWKALPDIEDLKKLLEFFIGEGI